MKKLISSVVIAGAVMGGNVYAAGPVIESPNGDAGIAGSFSADGVITGSLQISNQKITDGANLIMNNIVTSTRSEVFEGATKDTTLTTKGYVDKEVGSVQTQVTNISNRVDGLQNRISEVERNSYAGIAGVAAISQIQVAPGKDFAIGVGVGTYRGQSTAAVGAAARINENLHFRAGFSGSGVAAAGLTFSW